MLWYKFKFETIKHSFLFCPQKYLYFKYLVCSEIFQNFKILYGIDIFHFTNCIQVKAKNLHVKMSEPPPINQLELTEWQLWGPSLAL